MGFLFSHGRPSLCPVPRFVSERRLCKVLMTMPIKRSSDSSGRNGVFLIHSLPKTCGSPEEADLKTQTLFEQEDDCGIKSGE